MINLKNLITEGSKKVTIPFRHVQKGGKEDDQKVDFSVHIHNHVITFLPKTSKDLDKINYLGHTKDDMSVLIKNHVKRTSKVELVPDTYYPGAGYGFNINYDKIISQIK